MSKVSEDLLKERAKCSFDIQELIHIIDGGEHRTQMRKDNEKLVLSIKELKDEIPEEYMSHKEKYENAIRKGSILYDLLLKITDNNPQMADTSPSNLFRIQQGVSPSVDPFLLHAGLFLPTIMSQATEEQAAEWVKTDSKMLGTYGQTELGHGSNLRGLETTATFDPATDEFVLNSPSLSSYKFWPGGLGHTANSALIMAQLYIKGRCHGLHVFLVQIRDFDTHRPLPGIKVGEIGPKFGFNTANNGFLGFNNYRIPRTNMLMRNAQVLRDGTYKRSRNEKLTYGSMMLIRVMILTDVAFEVSAAATIAVRYSAVRHQSQLRSGEPEPQILDFTTQQHKLFISIASSHAFRVTGKWLWETYKRIINDVSQDNYEELPELHVLSCCLKAVVTRDGVSCADQCRFACGGHGYLMSSNLPGLCSILSATVTYEGEYTVLLMQTARYLAKAWNGATNGKTLPPTIAFLTDYHNKNFKKWNNSPEGIVEGFKAVAAGKIKAACDTIQNHMASGKDFEDSWNLAAVQLANASEAYGRSLLCDVYWNETQKLIKTTSNSLGIVLQQLAELYLVWWSLEKCGDLLLYSTISKDDIENLQQRYEELLALIRPNAVGLVDAFDVRDEILRSTLGAYDGRVYERVMEHAAASPLNAEPVNQTFHKYIKPLFTKNKL